MVLSTINHKAIHHIWSLIFLQAFKVGNFGNVRRWRELITLSRSSFFDSGLFHFLNLLFSAYYDLKYVQLDFIVKNNNFVFQNVLLIHWSVNFFLPMFTFIAICDTFVDFSYIWKTEMHKINKQSNKQKLWRYDPFLEDILEMHCFIRSQLYLRLPEIVLSVLIMFIAKRAKCHFYNTIQRDTYLIIYKGIFLKLWS